MINLADGELEERIGGENFKGYRKKEMKKDLRSSRPFHTSTLLASAAI